MRVGREVDRSREGRRGNERREKRICENLLEMKGENNRGE